MAALHARAFTTPRPWSAPEFRAMLDDPSVLLLVESDGFLLGRVVADEAEILTLAVDPDCRRQGTGFRLVTRFLDAARDRDAATAFLEVAVDNIAAVSLYERAGFTRQGRRKAYFRAPDGQTIDALVMACGLRNSDPNLTPPVF